MLPKKNITNKFISCILRIIFYILIISSIPFGYLNAQELKGCTDLRAKNYDPDAVINDGSCLYKTTIFNPVFKYLLPEEIKETSGLIYYEDALWTINDSGNLPIIYKFDPETGKILLRIRIGNAKNTDWETLAQDDLNIFIGDVGNNKGNRKYLKILIINKNDLAVTSDTVIMASSIQFTFSDHPGKQIKKKKKHNFDCEAMICVGDSLYLFSKNRGDQKTKLYRLSKREGVYEAEFIETFNSKGLITGADYNEELKELTLTGYTNKSWQPFVWLFFDFHDNHFFSGNKRRIDMLNIPATQTETIAYTIDRNCVITSEGHPLFSQTAYKLNTHKWIGEYDKEMDTLSLKHTQPKDY